LGDVRLALAELVSSLQGTFFRDYPLDLKILGLLPKDVSFDWYGLMRDAITSALLTAPHLESDFISRRCEELLRAYRDANTLVYQYELEVHELRLVSLSFLLFVTLMIVYRMIPWMLLVDWHLLYSVFSYCG
jgi:hypothetical protein